MGFSFTYIFVLECKISFIFPRDITELLEASVGLGQEQIVRFEPIIIIFFLLLLLPILFTIIINKYNHNNDDDSSILIIIIVNYYY